MLTEAPFFKAFSKFLTYFSVLQPKANVDNKSLPFYSSFKSLYIIYSNVVYPITMSYTFFGDSGFYVRFSYSGISRIFGLGFNFSSFLSFIISG